MNNPLLRLYVEAQTRAISAQRSRAAYGRRAAGMLEYVLLGAVAAAIIGFLLRGALSSMVEQLLEKIEGVINAD